MKRNFRRGAAAVCSMAMLASAVAFPAGTKVNAAYQLLGETDFEYKMVPWMAFESSPAMQYFQIEDGTLYIKILNAIGADREKWDLGIRHRNLSFQKGHTYEVEFSAKSARNGLQLCSEITNIRGDECYCTLDVDEIHNGPYCGGNWGKAARLGTEWTTYKGTFTPDADIDSAQWTFDYARGTAYEGNAENGDELWFDNMSILDVTEEVLPPEGKDDFGYVNRANSGLENNYISVNQLGYLCDSKKVAVIGNDKGDLVSSVTGDNSIDLTAAVKFDVVDAVSGDIVFTGRSGRPIVDEDTPDSDSGDIVCKLDFSEFNTPGRYYIKSGDYRSFEFRIDDDIYQEKGHDLLTNAMNYFYQNRSGIDIEAKYLTSGEKNELEHSGTHKSETGKVQKVWRREYLSRDEAAVKYKSSEIDTTGGWYEAGGDFAKNTVSGAMAVWTLQNMFERTITANPDVNMFYDGSGKVVIPEAGNKVPDVLDEAAYELDWMAKLKVDKDEPTWGESAAGLYYHKVSDHVPTGIAVKPWNYIYDVESWEPVRVVSPPTFAATLGYAACAAQAARLWMPYDKEKAEKYLASAMDAYDAYMFNYYEPDCTGKIHPDYGYETVGENINENSLYAPPTSGENNNYDDLYVMDDAYLAACEIFISASRMGSDRADEFLKNLESYKEAYKVSTELPSLDAVEGKSFTSFNWGNTAACGTLSLALNKELMTDKNAEKVNEQILKAANQYLEAEEEQGYGIPYWFNISNYEYLGTYYDHVTGYESFSNRYVLNNAVIMAYASDISGEQKYKDGVTTAMDYLLGTNPLSFSYITGYGSYSADSPYHRYWANSIDKTFPKAPDGVAVSGPSAFMYDEYMKSMGFVIGKKENYDQRCYADAAQAWSVNSVSLDTNASLAWVVAFLQDPAMVPAEPKPTPEKTPEHNPTAPPSEKTSPSPVPTKTPEVTKSPKPTESPKPTVSPVPTESPAAVKSPVPTEITEPTETPLSIPIEDPIPQETSDKYANAELILGDVNCDGKIDVTDLTTLAIALVDNEELIGMQIKNADVTGNGTVDLADLATLRMFLSKKIESFDK